MSDDRDQRSTVQGQGDALVAAHRMAPEAFQTNFDLGIFLATFVATVGDSVPFLLRAFNSAPSNEFRRRALEHLFYAYNYAGDSENEFRAIQTLAKHFPDNIIYREEYALICGRRGLVKEASELINADLDDSYLRAATLMKERGYDRPVQLVMDGDILFQALGELGCRFDLYVKARILGIAPPVRALCRSFRMSQLSKMSNQFLLDCWKAQVKDQIEFIDSREQWNELLETHPGCHLHFTKYRLPDGTGTGTVTAGNYVRRRWLDEGRAPLLRLPEETELAGRAWLSDLGVPEQAWFVCLHLRDGGDKKESTGTLNEYRNSRPENYLAAIRAITERGGWVVRVGNPSPFSMADLPHVIDYANAADKADWKDVFLLSRCRFFLGSNSGPVWVSRVFGVPTILTDFFPIGLCHGSPLDIVIHKLLRRGEGGEYLPIREAAAYGIGAEHSPAFYARHGLIVEDNSPEDIVDAVAEMLQRLEGGWRPSEADREREKNYAARFGMAPYGIGANIGSAFLAKHAFLVDG